MAAVLPPPRPAVPRLRGYSSDRFVLPLPPGHRFPMQKYRLLREAIAARLPDVELHEAPAASDAELLRAHTAGYVRGVVEGSLPPAMQREIGFPWSPDMVERSRRSVGATVAAMRDALREGLAGNLAGGTHHAAAEAGGGFCVFNDLAVAARVFQAERAAAGAPPPRIAVIDLDVHQGNGTAAILGADPAIYTLSMHGEKNFPFRKVPGRDEVDLPDGTGDAAYLDALDAALDRVWAWAPRPDLILYLAGADPYAGDRLGRLALSAQGLAERDRRVFAAALARRVPLAFCMGGGYGEVIEETVEIQLETWRLAAEHRARWPRPA